MGIPIETKPSVDSLPEVPYHEVQSDRQYKIHDGVKVIIPSGVMIEVWKIKNKDGFCIKARRPLEDGRQSVLTFGLSRDGAMAFHALLQGQIYKAPKQPTTKMKVNTSHPTRPTLSIGEGLRYQYEDLARWRTILTPEAYNALEEHCANQNMALPTGASGYDVFRGDQLTSFIKNYMNGLFTTTNH